MDNSAGCMVIMLIVAVGWWLFSFYLDSDSIRSDVEARGGEILEKQWNPFGKGWFGEKGERIYDVRYKDNQGNLHEAVCKTSVFTGVFWADDFVVNNGQKTARERSIEEENEQLRTEIEQLRAKLTKPDASDPDSHTS